MGRGGHRTGTKWKGDPKTDTIRIPVEIKEEVKQLAQQLWEEHKSSDASVENQLSDTDDN